MKLKKTLKFALSIVLLCLSTTLFAQTIIPVPPYGNTYTGSARGFWFTAPTDFMITGLRVPNDIGNSDQSIHLVRFNSAPPAYPGTATSFTTLGYWNGVTGNTIVSTQILVQTGDVIGVLGTRGTSSNSYGTPAGPFQSSILGQPVTLTRLLHQGSIATNPAPDFSSESTGNIARVEIYHEPAGEDAGVAEILSPGTPDCSNEDVYVKVVNDGSDTLTSVEIDWSIDGIQQNTVIWTGQLDPYGAISDSIYVGNASSLNQGEELKVWTANPNGNNDVIDSNDTLRFVLPVFGELDIPGQLVLCEGEVDTVSTGLTFSDHMWSDGSSKDFFEIETAGQYSVTTEDISTGCIQTANFNVIEEATVTLSDSVFGCTIDGGTTVSGNVPGSYLWSTGAGTSFLNITETGEYWVEVTEPTGKCTSSDTTYATIYDQPEAGFTGDVNYITISFTDTSNNATDILWEFGDGSSSSSENPVHIYPSQEGTYTITQVVSNICGSDSITHTFTVSPDQVNSVDDLSEINDLSVYPNPASSQVNVALDLAERMDVTLEVVDIQGRVIKMKNLGEVNGKQVFNFNASDLSSGIYILNIQSQKGPIGQRTLIVE